MNNELQQLLQLQEIDKVVDQINLDLAQLPLSIEEKRAQIKQNQESLNQKKEKLTEFQLARKNRELDLGSFDEKIRKHEGELNSVKSNDTYKALMNEIAAIKKQKVQVEDEILNLWEQAEKTNGELKTEEVQIKNNEQKMEAEIKEIEGEIGKTKELLEQEVKKRDEFASHLPEVPLKAYNYIRQKKKGIAIVSIQGDSCNGCNTLLTQNTINEVKKAKSLVQCDSCSRILYVENSQAAPAVPAA